MRSLLHKLSPKLLLGLKVFGLLFLLVLPHLGLNPYLMNIVIKVLSYTIMALGLNVLVGWTGLVSLGQAGFVAIGAYATVILAKDHGMNFFLAMLCGALIAGVFGLLLGLPTLRLKGTYLSIITLGFGEIVRTLIIVWDPVTNGPMGIRNIPRPSLFGIKMSLYNGGLYYLVLALLLLVMAFFHLLEKSKTGRALRAIKADETAAKMMGIGLIYHKVLAFVMAAVISALAGSFFAVQIGYIDQNTFTFDMSIMILSIVILGGMGTIRGMLMGSLILVVLPEISRALMDYRFVIYGLILVIMMRYRPQGLLGWRDVRPYPIAPTSQEAFEALQVEKKGGQE